MSISVSEINSGNGTNNSSNNGNWITKALSFVSSLMRRRSVRAPNVTLPSDPELQDVPSEFHESHGNDEFVEIPLSENIRQNPPIVLTDQTAAGHVITNGSANTRTILLNLQEIGPKIIKYLKDARDSITNDGSANTSNTLLNLQKIGLKIVKYLVMPTSLVVAPNAMTTSVNLFQVFTANNTVATSTKTFFLKPSFVSAIVNIGLGAILFVLSTSKGNFRGKVFFLKVTIILTTASTVVEIALLLAVGWQFVSLV